MSCPTSLPLVYLYVRPNLTTQHYLSSRQQTWCEREVGVFLKWAYFRETTVIDGTEELDIHTALLRDINILT